MARYQYRVAGTLGWMSNSGNALLAIANKAGSGKKITLARLEITPLHSTTTATAGTVSAAPPTALSLARATVAGGEAIPVTKADTSSSDWPATVRLVAGATVASPGIAITRIYAHKQLTQASLSWMARQGLSPNFGSAFRRPRRDSSVEGQVVRAGEGLALYVSTLQNAIPLRVTVRLAIGSASYHATYFTVAKAQDEAIFGIDNTAGSGEVVTLRGITVEEVGTFDSPYLQLVPVGALLEAENTTSPPIGKMDSAYPSPSSWLDVRQDVALLPYGMPENALADSSTGSPKGFNYLKTKDFLGPGYRAIFPEYIPHRPGATPDFIPCGQRFADPLVSRAGITIREGEAIALVSAAETAAGATAAVGCSGWSAWEIAVTFNVEPKLAPVLTITGLRNPSEVRIYAAGTTTLLAGQENVTSGSFAWTFDPETSPSVDIAVLSLGYQNLRFPAFALTLADTTIPVQQQIDRQYLNP